MNDLRHLEHTAKSLCTHPEEGRYLVRFHSAWTWTFYFGAVAIHADFAISRFRRSDPGCPTLRLTLIYRDLTLTLDDVAAMKDRDGDLHRPLQELIAKALTVIAPEDVPEFRASLPPALNPKD